MKNSVFLQRKPIASILALALASQTAYIAPASAKVNCRDKELEKLDQDAREYARVNRTTTSEIFEKTCTNADGTRWKQRISYRVGKGGDLIRDMKEVQINSSDRQPAQPEQAQKPAPVPTPADSPAPAIDPEDSYEARQKLADKVLLWGSIGIGATFAGILALLNRSIKRSAREAEKWAASHSAHLEAHFGSKSQPRSKGLETPTQPEARPQPHPQKPNDAETQPSAAQSERRQPTRTSSASTRPSRAQSAASRSSSSLIQIDKLPRGKAKEVDLSQCKGVPRGVKGKAQVTGLVYKDDLPIRAQIVIAPNGDAYVIQSATSTYPVWQLLYLEPSAMMRLSESSASLSARYERMGSIVTEDQAANMTSSNFSSTPHTGGSSAHGHGSHSNDSVSHSARDYGNDNGSSDVTSHSARGHANSDGPSGTTPTESSSEVIDSRHGQSSSSHGQHTSSNDTPNPAVNDTRTTDTRTTYDAPSSTGYTDNTSYGSGSGNYDNPLIILGGTGLGAAMTSRSDKGK